MMEEESMKRNTDCVYFLTSPLTCKKGAECEYRHSDMARLNPRDCWYWLSRNCRNPTCAFRHPPLEVQKDGPTEATAAVPNQSSMPAKKTTVPCYFYYNGFCNKGDRCPFLHEPDGTVSRQPKMSNAVADAPAAPLESKTSVRSDSGPELAGKQSTPSEMAVISGIGMKVQKIQLSRQSPVINVPKQTAPIQTYVSECEEPTPVQTVSLQPKECSPYGEYEPGLEPDMGSNQRSEELIDGNVVQDEWCESSPGFDVLVDGQSEDIAYEDDLEYMNQHDRTDGDYKQPFVQHGCVDQTRRRGRGFFVNGLCQPSSDDELRASPRHTRDRKVRCVVSRKRNFFSVESPIGSCDNADLRDYLSKRRRTDLFVDNQPLRYDSVRRRDDRPERVRRDVPYQRLHGRLTSKVERNGVELGGRRSSVAAVEQRGRLGNSEYNGYQRNEIKRRHPSTKAQQRSYLKRERDAHESTYMGSKRMSGNKEGRRHDYRNKNGSVEFEGPKPLSEILKEKRKASSSGVEIATGCP